MSAILPYLFWLSCPIGMGLMMVMMMRPKPQSTGTTSQEKRLIELEDEVARLRQERLDAPAHDLVGVDKEPAAR